MNALLLRLTSTQFGVLVNFMRYHTTGHAAVPLRQRPLGVAVLASYLDSLTGARLYTWFTIRRHSPKFYALKLPLPVALALHTEMQHMPLTGEQQLLLGIIDQAMVNYRSGGPQSPTDLLLPRGGPQGTF